jgi:hypothetical protein
MRAVLLLVAALSPIIILAAIGIANAPSAGADCDARGGVVVARGFGTACVMRADRAKLKELYR